MTFLPGRQVTGSFEFIRPSAEFADTGTSRNGLGQFAPAGGNNGGDAGGWSAVPNAYASWQVLDALWIGIGVSVPFGLKTEYDQNFIGRFQSQRAEVKTININPSVAWRVNGLVIARRRRQLPARFSGDQPLPQRAGRTPGPHRCGMIRRGAGMSARCCRRCPARRIGLAYRSDIKYNMRGDIATNAPAFVAPNGDVALSIRVPRQLEHQRRPSKLGAVQLLADFTYTRWDSVKSPQLIAQTPTLGTPPGGVLSTFNLQFRNSYRAGLGANWQIAPAWVLKAGVAYDKTPVTDAFRSTFLPDNDRKWLAIGAKWRATPSLAVDVGYAHLFINDATINAQQLATGGGNVIGNYRSSVDILGAQVTFAF